MECSPSNFGKKPGKRSHEIQERGMMEKEEARAAAGLRAWGPLGPKERCFPKIKLATYQGCVKGPLHNCVSLEWGWESGVIST